MSIKSKKSVVGLRKLKGVIPSSLASPLSWNDASAKLVSVDWSDWLFTWPVLE